MSTRRTDAARRDEGMSLIETIVALFIVAVVMTSSGIFFINGMKHGSLQSQRQTAVSIANQALEAVQAVDPKKLVVNRTSTDVTALLATYGAAALTAQDVTTSGNYDPSPTPAAAPLVPTTGTQTVSGVVYSLRTFIDQCYLTSAASQTCTATPPTPPTPAIYRATVAVTWPGKGASCVGGCRYAASVLIDQQNDPKFNTNVSTPAITNVTPSLAAAGTSRTLTIDGSGFVAGAQIVLPSSGGSTATPTSNTGTQITVVWTAGTTAGTYELAVVNPDGGRASWNLTVTSGPTITSLSPNPISSGAATTVTLTGSGFLAGSTVTLAGGSVSGVTYVSPTTLTATFTPASTTSGAATVTVSTPDGGATSRSITVQGPPPVISAATQGSVSTRGQPTTVTLTGSGYATGATVTTSTGTGSISGYSVTSSGSITVTYVPAATSESVTFLVRNPDGQSASRAVTVTSTLPALAITSATTVKSNNGNSNVATVTLTGTGFTATATATATWTGGSATVSGLVVGSDTRITFTADFPNGTFSKSVTYTLSNGDGRTVSTTQTVTL